MTNDDDATLFVRRYRASVEDVAAPNLDQIIMAAAGRHAAKRRFVRRAGGAFLVTAAIVSIGVGWHAHQSSTNRSIPTVTNYGAIEGLTRPYLLQVGTTQYSGPGLTEGIQ